MILTACSRLGEVEDPVFIDPRGAQIHGWVHEHFSGNATEDMFPRYLTSIYWSFQTMTTVGYGDYAANTESEMVTASISMLIGAGVFGMIVGKLSDLIRKQNPGDKYRAKIIAHISAYLGNRRVNAGLTRRVRGYFADHYNETTVFGECFQGCSTSVRADTIRPVAIAGATEMREYFDRLPTGPLSARVVHLPLWPFQ